MAFPSRLFENVVPSITPVNTRIAILPVERLLDIDVDRISHLWDAQKCHIDDLPYLAWALSVDIWNPNWSEQKKRSVVGSALEMHRLKGTEEGIRRYIDLVDSKLLRTIAPPARGFYTPVLTQEGRKAYLRDLPQVRIYPFLTKRIAPKKRSFYSGSGGRRSFYRDVLGKADSFAQTSDGLKLYGRKATFFDRGVEVPAQYDILQSLTAAPAERIRITRTGVDRGFYNNSFYGHTQWQATRADDNIISVRLSGDAVRQFATFSGMKVTDVSPERIYQGRTAPIGRRFYGKRKGFYESTFGPNLVFDRVTILDKSRLGPRQKVRNYWGHTRYGIKPFSAELLVEVPMNRAKPVLGKFMRGFWKAADLSPLQDTLTSIRTSKSFRDTIRVDTQVHRRVRLGDVLKLGTFKLGEIRRLI